MLRIDHLSLIPGKKEAIDAISRATVTIRNVTGIVSPILIAQFNRDNSNMERLKGGLQEPTKNDFKDSGGPYEDSSVCLALFSPHSHKLSTYRKYNVKILEQCLISVTLLKSRFGSSDIVVPFNFFGDITHYIEMPKPDEIYDYSKYTNPNYLLKDDLEFTDDEKDDPAKLYNELLSNGTINAVIHSIPASEWEYLLNAASTIKEDKLKYRNTIASVINNFVENLPVNANAAKDIIEKFNPEDFQNIMNFVKAANGGRDIN